MYSQLIKQAMEIVQQNAQANVPVIPNNGNPQGANNMPSQPTLPQPPGNAWGNKYSWLAPSPSMDMVNQLLAQPIIQPPAVTPPAPGPNIPTPDVGPPQPILPVNGIPGKPPRMGFNDGAVLPRRNGQPGEQGRQGDIPVVPRGMGYSNYMRR